MHQVEKSPELLTKIHFKVLFDFMRLRLLRNLFDRKYLIGHFGQLNGLMSNSTQDWQFLHFLALTFAVKNIGAHY